MQYLKSSSIQRLQKPIGYGRESDVDVKLNKDQLSSRFQRKLIPPSSGYKSKPTSSTILTQLKAGF